MRDVLKCFFFTEQRSADLERASDVQSVWRVIKPRSEMATGKCGMEKKNKHAAWTKPTRRPVVVDKYALDLARKINYMLARPAPILSLKAGDLMLPFALGTDATLRERLKPEASAKAYALLMQRYTRGAAYLLALAQLDSRRFDIEGQPVEPVSEEHRIRAKYAYLALRERLKQLRAERQIQAESAQDQVPAPSDGI